jgi:hypothetical protein
LDRQDEHVTCYANYLLVLALGQPHKVQVDIELSDAFAKPFYPSSMTKNPIVLSEKQTSPAYHPSPKSKYLGDIFADSNLTV